MTINKLPEPDIVINRRLEGYVNELLQSFLGGDNLDKKKLSEFLNTDYFTGGESLIGALTANHPDLNFNEIKNERINLRKLVNPQNGSQNNLRDFNELIRQTSTEFQNTLKETIKQSIINEIGTAAPYDNFDIECNIDGIDNPYDYINKILEYLESKKSSTNGRNPDEVLINIDITNEDINNNLGVHSVHPGDIINTINPNIKNGFDKLLSFEIGKEAGYSEKIINSALDSFKELTSNMLPPINTLLVKSKYKYDESKFGPNFKTDIEAIQNENINEYEKQKRIQAKKRQHYIEYLKHENGKLGDVLEHLYQNNFDYSKLSISEISDYLQFVAKENTKSMFFEGIAKSFDLDFGMSGYFQEFYKNLADPTVTHIDMGHGFNFRATKTVIEGENARLTDLDNYGENAKAFDSFPIKIEIDKSEINNSNISLEDKEYLLKILSEYSSGETDPKYTFEKCNIGKLVFLYLLLNNSKKCNGIDNETKAKIEKVFTPIEKGDITKGKEFENPVQDFKDNFEKLGPGKFENGSEICIPISDSKLPGGGHSRMRLRISDIDNLKGTFTGEGIGTEFKYNKKYKRTFNMNQEELNNINSINKGQILLLPENNSTDFKSYVSSIKDKNGNEVFQGIPELQGKHFIHEVERDGKKTKEKVNYFSTEGENPGSYKISYNPIKKTFNVASTFLGKEKNKKGEEEDVNYKYEQEMDYPSFLLFFKEKQLKPQTDEDAQIQAQKRLNDTNKIRITNGGKRKINWFTIGNLKAAISSIYKKIKTKLDDYNKAQNEKLEDIIIGDWKIYDKLSSVLGFIPSMKEGLGELQMEHYNKRDKDTWKKIEGYLNQLKEDPDFGATFTEEPPHIKTLYGKSFAKIIEDRVKNATDQLGDPGIHQAAALLLANIQKGKSPYRGLSCPENSGIRIKALLGNAHYENFLREKEKCIQARDRGEDIKGMNSLLANCELTYIINNIKCDDSPSYFGSIEEKGIDGGKKYIDNPSKRILSSKFADELKTASGWISEKEITDSYNNLQSNDFGQVEKEFGKMKSSRYQQGLGALRKMFDLAQTEEQKNHVKKHFLAYLLSGVLDVYCDPKITKKTYQRAKTIGFIPGMLANKPGVAENVAILLDKATNGDFSRQNIKYMKRKDIINGNIDFKNVESKLNRWLDSGAFEKIEQYLKNDFPTENFKNEQKNKKDVLEAFQKALLNTDRESFDNSILDNPNIINNGLLTNINVVNDRMDIKDGEFTGKDADEKTNKEKFWKQVTTDIKEKTKDINNPENVSFVLNQFLNRFRLNNNEDKTEIYKWICTAEYRSKNINKRNLYDYNGKGKRLDMGKIGNKEVDSIVWYSFMGKAWESKFGCNNIPEELKDTLNAFQDFFKKIYETDINILKNSFKIGNNDIKHYQLGSRDCFDNSRQKDNETYEEQNDDSNTWKNDKERRQAQRRTFDGFINKHIWDIEQRFKKRDINPYPVTRSINYDLESRFKLLDS